jgi:chromatin segregation and condensation protein Rec8/ScpA/Scc1 (kleisin family)
MSDKLVDDVVQSVQLDETFKQASQKLSTEERESLEAGVREMAELMAPFLRVVEALSQDDEALALAKARLSEKPSGG